MKSPGMLGVLVIISLSIIAATVQAEVYKTVDKDGNVVYTDQPPEPGAEPMKLRELSVVPVPNYNVRKRAVAAPESVANADGTVTDLNALKRGYRDFALVSPTPEQTFTGTGNVATIAWDTQYALQPGMTVVVSINGEALPPTTASVMTSPPLDRGEHRVTAELVDADQRVIATAGPVNFYIFQHSVQNQNRPIPTPRGGGG